MKAANDRYPLTLTLMLTVSTSLLSTVPVPFKLVNTLQNQPVLRKWWALSPAFDILSNVRVHETFFVLFNIASLQRSVPRIDELSRCIGDSSAEGQPNPLGNGRWVGILRCDGTLFPFPTFPCASVYLTLLLLSSRTHHRKAWETIKFVALVIWALAAVIWARYQARPCQYGLKDDETRMQEMEIATLLHARVKQLQESIQLLEQLSAQQSKDIDRLTAALQPSPQVESLICPRPRSPSRGSG